MTTSSQTEISGPPMNTATATLTIVCPNWCTMTTQQHADDLWNNGGNVFHHAPSELVEDATGFREAFEEPLFYPPAAVSCTTSTNPEGRETASPTFYLDGHEHSLEQFEATLEAGARLVALYRGGVPA